ncbi:MAG: isoprenylcysteine carboxylmethyltransferase family protein [Bacteroidaceae bacterium]|nr:isoprenylcysteine carboxylmethyltransferase family protein [Bacteroidaceae bacterium]
MKLLLKTLIAFLSGLLITGAMLFVPAGTLAYRGAWLFIALLFISILIMGAVLFVKNPELLRKRLEMKEREKEQKGVVALSGLLLVASFIVAGLDFRFGWSHVSNLLVIISSVILLVGYALYAEVLRENVYLSRVVEVQANQRVIDTGLYGIVRHPMYLAVTLLYLAIPLVLGSWWALLMMSPCILLLAARIKNEEQVLHQGLPGYTDYTKRVRYRMIPWIW